LIRSCESPRTASGVPIVCTVENSTPGDPVASTTEFEIAYCSYNFFSPVITWSPPDSTVTSGEDMPLGR